MAKIPTFSARSNIQTGSTGPRADPGSFGAFEAQALGGLANATANVGRTAESIATKIAGDKAIQWNLESFNKMKNELAVWQSENFQREDYSTAFQEFSEEVRQRHRSLAPNKIAEQMFDADSKSEIQRRFEGAIGVEAKTRVANDLEGMRGSMADALATFRSELKTPGVNAYESLNTAYIQGIATITKKYGDIAPGQASELRAELTRDVVLASGEHNPAFAKRILDSSKDVDERTRASLEGFIENASNNIDSGQQIAFSKELEDSYAYAQETNAIFKIPPEKTFIEKFGKAGPREYARWQRRAEIQNTAAEVLPKLASLNVNASNREYEKLRAKASNSAAKLEAFDNIRRRLDQIHTHQLKDSAGWMTKHNEEVFLSYNFWRNAAARTDLPQETKQQYFNRYIDNLKKYQGPPPRNEDGSLAVTQEEADLYLDLPTQARKIVPESLALDWASKFNKAGPRDVFQVYADFLNQYEGNFFDAWSDLVNLPGDKGVRQELQLAFLPDDPLQREHYINLTRDPKALAELTTEKKSDFEEAMDENPIWGQFQAALLNSEMQRVDEIAGFKKGLILYANALSLAGPTPGSESGLSPKDAVAKSIKLMIENTGGFTKIHGGWLFIPKKRSREEMARLEQRHKEGITVKDPASGREKIIEYPIEFDNERSEEEIEDIGRRIHVALKHIDPRDIGRFTKQEMDRFPTLPPEGISEVEAAQQLRNIITSSAYPVASSDGQSFTLWVEGKGEGDLPFELRDKQGRPFRAFYEDLPIFRKYVAHPTTMGISLDPIRPEETYSILKSQLSEEELRAGGIIESITDMIREKKPVFPKTGDFWVHQREDKP